jgi:cytochrome c-type biogenesis protein CcsB
MNTNIENFLANFSFIILFISMFIYWIQASNLSFSSSVVLSNPSYQGSVPADSPPSFRRKAINVINSSKREITTPLFFNYNYDLKNLGPFGILLSNFLLFFLLLIRWKESGHFPLSNLYESLMFLSWSLTLIHLIIEISFKGRKGLQLGTKKERKNPLIIADNRKEIISKLIGSITAPSALFTNAFATFSLPKEMQEASPLVPALQSNWLMMHVTVMILSYAALILGSLLSIGFLIIINIAENNVKNNYKENLAKTLDNLSYRVLGLGFPLLTIGILSGSVWANEAWGSYWSWDPKETWALLTWLVFAIYLHTRLNQGWEGKKPALIASLGFVTVWICFLGVNLIGEGLHSYGWLG